MFLLITSKLLDLDQIRMGWIRDNSVDKKNLTKEIFSRQFSVALINSILKIFYHYLGNTQQLKYYTSSKQERTAVYGLLAVRPQFQILNSPGKMMTCYLREINKFLRQRTLCKSILKCRFPTKGIELTWFVLFEVLRVLSFDVPWFRPFLKVQYKNLRNTSETME